MFWTTAADAPIPAAAAYQNELVQRSIPGTSADGNVTALHCSPDATVHVVVGTGGAAFTRNAQDPSPAWSEMVFYKYGYARVSVFNGKGGSGGLLPMR